MYENEIIPQKRVITKGVSLSFINEKIYEDDEEDIKLSMWESMMKKISQEGTNTVKNFQYRHL